MFKNITLIAMGILFMVSSFLSIYLNSIPYTICALLIAYLIIIINLHSANRQLNLLNKYRKLQEQKMQSLQITLNVVFDILEQITK